MSRDRSGGLRTLLVVSAAVTALVFGAMAIGWTLLSNPFERTTVDRSPPPVLTSLQQISEFHAARGSFEVLIDMEHDVQYVPSIFAGERILFIGVGEVDAYVDFSRLDDGAITVSEDGTAVSVEVPRPQLTDPAIDPTESHVVDRDKGIFDRVADLLDASGGSSEQELYVAASQKMADAAESAGLAAQAEDSTRKMLEGLLSGLGYETVQVTFVDLPPAG
ncbi:MAG: DUF4230 domain-containing protein [Ilumatobacteraceae bacterium]